MDFDMDKPRIQKLTGVNYRTWKIQVSRLLRAHGLHGMITSEGGGVQADTIRAGILGGKATTEEELLTLDAKASTLIMGLCTSGPLDYIVSLETAAEQWKKLEELYAPFGLQQLDTKTQAFINYKPLPNATIATISTELNTLQTEIGGIDRKERPTDQMKLSILFRAARSLNTMYDPVILQLGLAKVNTYEDVVLQLTEYERRLAADKKVIKENAFIAKDIQGLSSNKKKKGFTGKCFNCGIIGHRKSECRRLKNEQNKSSTGPLLTPGGGRGLSPPGERTSHDAMYTNEISWMAFSSAIPASADSIPTRVIDSGCSRHMTYSRDVFGEDYQRLQQPIHIRTANGATIEAIGEGSALLKVAVGEEIRDVLLRRVLHVPALSGSLISVLQLQDRGIQTRTTTKGDICLELNNKIIGRGIRIGKAYVLASQLDMQEAVYKASVNDSMIWHRRFAHLSSSSLHKVHEVTSGMDKEAGILQIPCQVCDQSKLTRNINRQPQERALKLLERVHTDAWGPYRIPTLKGERYFFTFTDDYSRKTWVFLTSNRAKLRDIFTEFKIRVELEAGSKIQAVRCDNISEYRSLAAAYEGTYGIKFEFSTVYTPEQNGTAERLNRTLITCARTMLLDANLPARFWGEAVETACYIRNRTPIGPGGKTPEEVYSGKKPSINHLRAWGCVAYAYLAPAQRGNDKLKPVAIRTCLVGYTPTTRQYRLYDPVKDKIIVSTAPKFREEKRLDITWKDGSPAKGESTLDLDETDLEFPVNLSISTQRQQSEIGTQRDDSNRENEDATHDNTERQPQREATVPLSALPSPSPSGQHPQKEKRWQAYQSAPGFRDFEPEILDSRRRSQRTQDRQATIRVEEARIANIGQIPIPKSYEAAIEDKIYGAEWKAAIQTEFTTLQALGTWDFADLPEGKKTVEHKWVFTVKYTPTGQVDRFKARLTAQGFSQVYGEDFYETFSPTMRTDSLRVLLAIASFQNLHIHQLDVVSAYPRSKLHAEVYMRIPKGLKAPPGKILQLNTSLYGLKQSGREWYIEASHGLRTLGFSPLASDPSVFALGDRSLIIGLYVDDMILLCADKQQIKKTIASIQKLWDIKDIGDVERILGLNIQRNNNTITISQTVYIEETISKFELGNAKPAMLPVSDRNTLTTASQIEPQANQSLYQQAIGRLMWIANSTRFDISYVVGQLSQHCNKPAVRHWNSVLQVLRYLSGTRHLKLTLGGKLSPHQNNFGYRLHGFSDADYAGDSTDRKSVSGYIYLLNGGPVSWSSTKQRCVSTSTTEAEYIALSDASKQGQWLRTLLKELQQFALLEDNQAVPMHSDNQACIILSQDPVGHRRTKHIDVRYHYIRELVTYKKATVEYLKTADMIADILTKPLPVTAFTRCIGNLLMV